MQMTIDTLSAGNIISEAITAIDNCCSYDELKTSTIRLISALSYLVGYIEGMQGDTDDES